MALKRYKTAYPGVFYRLVRRIGGKAGDTEKVYYAIWKEQGKKIEVRCGSEYRDGMTPSRAARMRGEFIEGKRLTPQQKKAQNAATPTLAGLLEAYVPTLVNPRSRGSAETDFRRLPDALANKRPHELTRRDFEILNKDMAAKGLSPQTRRHTLALIVRLVRWGEKQGLCQPLSFEVVMPRVDNMKTEFLDDTQLARLMAALDADFNQTAADAVRFVIFTGVRRGALFALEWRDIDMERGFITLRGEVAKSGRTCRIPMSESVKALLSKIRPLPNCPYVFPTERGERRQNLSREFIKRIRKMAGLPEGFRFLHGLRHTFASRLASSGQVDLYTLQHLLTHESSDMTQRYSHLMDEALHRAASVVDAVMQPQGK